LSGTARGALLFPAEIVQEHIYTYTSAAPTPGKMVALILPEASTAMMNLFLEQVNQTFSQHFIVRIGITHRGPNASSRITICVSEQDTQREEIPEHLDSPGPLIPSRTPLSFSERAGPLVPA
jgi:hypothetical protein